MEKRTSITRNTISRRKHKTFATIGMVVFALAIVGLMTVAAASLNLTGSILDNTKEKQKLEHLLLPVIMFDPNPFDSLQDADPQMILESSIWSALLSRSREELTVDDIGYIILPVSDVEVQAAKLYGSDIKLQHQTFMRDYETQYNYSEEQKVYKIPLVSQLAVYTPRILKITHKGDIYTLEVGYIPPGNLWTTDADGNTYEPEPDKIMIMELQKVKGNYNILSLKPGPDTQASLLNPNESQVTPSVSSEPDELSSGEEAPSGTESSGSEPPSSSSESSSSSSEEESNEPPVFDKVTASSTAEPSGGRTYEAENVLDGDWDTAWIEGKEDDGIGEYLLFEAEEEQYVQGIRMTNGYTEKDILYERNNRITKITIEFDDGTSESFELNNYDELYEIGELGTITFSKPVKTTSIKLIIDEVESGSVYSDSCISVVEFF